MAFVQLVKQPVGAKEKAFWPKRDKRNILNPSCNLQACRYQRSLDHATTARAGGPSHAETRSLRCGESGRCNRTGRRRWASGAAASVPRPCAAPARWARGARAAERLFCGILLVLLDECISFCLESGLCFLLGLLGLVYVGHRRSKVALESRFLRIFLSTKIANMNLLIKR